MLLDLIRKSLRALPSVRECPPDQAALLLDRIAARYVRDRKRVLWWDNLSVESVSVEYGAQDGLSALRRLVSDDNAVCLLFVSDEESPPWPVLVGTLHDLLKVISEQSFFEFVMSDEEGTWAVFDTHHNSLVVCGSLRDRAGRNFPMGAA